jgi:hypothetical protein
VRNREQTIDEIKASLREQLLPVLPRDVLVQIILRFLEDPDERPLFRLLPRNVRADDGPDNGSADEGPLQRRPRHLRAETTNDRRR